MSRTWGAAVDALVALCVLVTGLAEVWVPFQSRSGAGSEAATTLQVVIVAAALLARRAYPLPCAVVVASAFLAFHLLGVAFLLFNGQFVPLVLVTFAVARHARGRLPYAGGALMAATMLTADLAIPSLREPAELIFHWSVLGVAYGLGTWQRIMAVREVEARRRAVRAEVAAAAAVLQERTRIARELHDVVAHAMSVIVVQAGATELVADEPDQVRRALRSIRRTGSDALGEMRRLVTMLRDADETASRSPQPGVGAVGDLLEDARSAGLPVRLEVTGEARDLPAGLDLAAYRIVQEALTNARRHAEGATEVTVHLDFASSELRIEVRDDGAGSGATSGSGHGLVGMRERVALYGGRLHAGPLPRSGFAVRVALPLEPA